MKGKLERGRVGWKGFQPKASQRATVGHPEARPQLLFQTHRPHGRGLGGPKPVGRTLRGHVSPPHKSQLPGEVVRSLRVVSFIFFLWRIELNL